MGRKDEIIKAMSLKKDSKYPDATPAVFMALAQARKQCAADASALAERVGADEE